MAEEETLGGREGGRWAAQRKPLGGRERSWRFRWEPLGLWDCPPGGRIFPPQGAAVGGTTLVAQNGSKRTENGCFPEGAGPAPRPDSEPTWSTSTGPVGAG